MIAVMLTACAVVPPAQQQEHEQQRQRPAVVRQNRPVRGKHAPAPGPAEAKAKRTDGATRANSQGPEVSESAEPAQTSTSPVYRVTEDGTVGCADPQAVRILRRLRDAGGASPRLLAQAHRDGQCMTVYRVNKWVSEGSEADMIKLRLLDGSRGDRPASLYFFREQVELQP